MNEDKLANSKDTTYLPLQNWLGNYYSVESYLLLSDQRRMVSDRRTLFLVADKWESLQTSNVRSSPSRCVSTSRVWGKYQCLSSAHRVCLMLSFVRKFSNVSLTNYKPFSGTICPGKPNLEDTFLSGVILAELVVDVLSVSIQINNNKKYDPKIRLQILCTRFQQRLFDD